MYAHDNIQYIFKLSNGKIINIFYKENSGIYISYLGRRNMWLEATPLIRDASPGFSADMDLNDNLYILYQDTRGNIMRGRLSNDIISTKSILSSKNPSTGEMNLRAVCSGDSIYYFYVLEYSGSKLLSYQVQNGSGNISTPQVIDYVYDSPVPFTILNDLQSGLHVFYKSSDNKNPYIGYKSYDTVKDQWSSFRTISNKDLESCVISIAVDYENNYHAVWQIKQPARYDIVHSRKTQASDKWEEEKVIVSSQNPLYDSSLIAINNMLIFYWVKDNVIFHTNAAIKSGYWSEPEKYQFEAKTLYCMKYKSNDSEELRNSRFSILPGSFLSGYKLAFINDNGLKPGMPSINDVRELFSDSVKNFSNGFDKFNQKLTELKNKIDELEARQQHMETELSKLGIKTNLMDNEMSKLNSNLSNLPQRNNQYYFWEKQPPANPNNKREDSSSVDLNKNVDSNINKQIALISPPAGDINKIPVMPGTGFASVTPEFLKGLKK